MLFQSTHPVWGATVCIPVSVFHHAISIHAPRVGCDTLSFTTAFAWVISIHAPRVGCDMSTFGMFSTCLRFQSTHPVWGAT